MKLTFCGAARQVTGNMFLLELNDGYKILVECGTDLSASRLEREELFPFDPSDIDLVLLTHAHIDHSGRIPLLFREGYKGQVLCTTPTLALSELLLHDAAGLNKQRIMKKWNPRRRKLVEHIPADIYLERQVEIAAERFVGIAFNQKFEVKGGISVTFIPAGHLLGAASIVIEAEENGTVKSIAFSGDLGRTGYPLLEDPGKMPQVDYLVCESTYGDREHVDEGSPEEKLEEIITKACVDIPGRLIIPAFSVGRTQSLLYTFNKLSVENKLPPIKVFADSPMADQSTQIYQKYVSYMNDEAKTFNEKHGSLFDFKNLVCVSSQQESRAISDYRKPSIVIASSGMLTGGRMNNHIQKNIKNPYSSIMFVGYCAEGTPGHELRNSNHLTINGRSISVEAKVLYTDIYSGHADCNDLLKFVKQQDKEKLKKVFLVHGDYNSMLGFKTKLNTEGYKVEMPEKDQTFVLN